MVNIFSLELWDTYLTTAVKQGRVQIYIYKNLTPTCCTTFFLC